MAVIRKNALVPYTPTQMFELVNRIEDYPYFLPWCKETTVYSRSDHEVKARVVVAKGVVEHAFITVNRLQRDKMIEMRLLEGPFRHLEGFWQFDTVEEGGCSVYFNLEFEFSNKLINLTSGPVLQKIAASFIEAFCERAKTLYGDYDVE